MSGTVLVLIIGGILIVPQLIYYNKIITLIKRMNKTGWYILDSNGNKTPTKDLLLYNKLTFAKLFDR